MGMLGPRSIWISVFFLFLSELFRLMGTCSVLGGFLEGFIEFVCRYCTVIGEKNSALGDCRHAQPERLRSNWTWKWNVKVRFVFPRKVLENKALVMRIIGYNHLGKLQYGFSKDNLELNLYMKKMKDSSCQQCFRVNPL